LLKHNKLLIHWRNNGEVKYTSTNGKKSSVSLVSSLVPYISFIVGSQKVSLIAYSNFFSMFL